MKQAATLFILFAVLSGRLFAQDVAEAARQAKAAKAAAAHQQAKAAAPQAQQTTQAPEPAPVVQPAANVSTGSTSSRSFIGHRLGETWATFTSTEPDAAQSATSKQGNCVHGYKHFHKTVECKTFILQGWEKRIDIASGFRLDVKYKFCPNVTGTLCAIEVSPNIEMYSRVKLDINQQTEMWPALFNVQLAQLAQKFGPATKTSTRTFQNAYGAHWEYPQAEWVFDDGTCITADEWRSQDVGWVIKFKQQPKESDLAKVNNPY